MMNDHHCQVVLTGIAEVDILAEVHNLVEEADSHDRAAGLRSRQRRDKPW